MSARKSPFRFHGRVPLLLALVIGLLALPGLTGLLHDNAQAIRDREQRRMAEWPDAALWRQDPQAYIAACDAWMKDAVGFRLRANAACRILRYLLFRKAPTPALTIGEDGHVFLNSPDASRPYFFFDNLCRRQLEPAPELFRQMDRTLAAADRVFRRRGARVIFAVAPTPLSLYPDKLPAALDPSYLRACRAYPGADHLLARLLRHSEARGEYRVFYPYALFAARKDEPHFYPKERYHWEGKSAYLFARQLLRESGAMAAPPPDDPAVLGRVEDDIAAFFGFSRAIEAYIYAYPDRPSKPWPEFWIRRHSERGQLFRFTTENSLTDGSALLIANSFGVDLIPHLARCFRHLYTFDLNFLQAHEQRDVFAALAKRVRVDHVFFVVDDVNANRLPEWLEGLVRLDEERARKRARDDKGSGRTQ